MNTQNYFPFPCLLFLLLWTGCGPKDPLAVKVDNFSNGKAAEVIVIMDNPYWTEAQREKIDSVLTQPQLILNQVEPLFDLLHFQNADFTAHFQRHRNIVRFDINPNYSSNVLNLNTNVFASPQVYAYFRGNNTDSLVALFLQNKEEIVHLLYENDLKRLQTAQAKNRSVDLEKLIRDKFGITLTIPAHYTIARQEEDCLWLANRTARNDRFLFLYKMPAYPLTPENLMDARDAMTKKYIPGALPGAYPVIARKAAHPFCVYDTLAGRPGMAMRGLWETVNDHMGGPFYNFTFTDSNTGHTISIDGFVYAPEEAKRDYLREVESIARSLR